MSKEPYLHNIQLAELCEREADVIKSLKQMMGVYHELNNEERNKLAVAYKNALNKKLNAWKMLKVAETGEKYGEQIKQYRAKVEGEVDTMRQEVEALMDVLVKHTQSPEAKVYYIKMKADYYRYYANLLEGERQKKVGEKAMEFYKEGSDIADKNLSAVHPIRLGLCLNYSVLFYDVLKNVESACKIAKTGFYLAFKELSNLPDELYNDASSIMFIIKDNLTKWTEESQETHT